MKINWVGLTGGIGCGKSQVSQYFQELGIFVIDSDSVNRELISTPNSDALIEIERVFGKDYLENKDGNQILNRAKMRDLIFHNPESKQKLEEILHPLIIQKIQVIKQNYQDYINNNYKYGIIEIPILTEKPIFRVLVNRIALIQSTELIRINRVKQRSGLNEQEIRAIMANQASDEERLAIADDMIENNHDLITLKNNVQQLHDYYQEIFK